MGNPLLRGEKVRKAFSWLRLQDRRMQFLVKNSGFGFAVLVIAIYGSVFRFWNSEPTFYAKAAYSQNDIFESQILECDSRLFETDKTNVAQGQVTAIPSKIMVVGALADYKNAEVQTENKISMQSKFTNSESIEIFQKKSLEEKKNQEFADKLYGIVGETPIKEMIPFISKRNDKVAAFLVAIAKKESSLGEHSPSLEGKDCYNYWGYKGSAGRGTSMGYACFANAEEAVKIVGDRIEVLVNKDRNTPSRMVDTWKCGSSCAGDPGAPSWVSTVALYFEKILG